jgi:hypothetical protein
MVPELRMEYKFHFCTHNRVISEPFAKLTLNIILKHPTSCCNIHSKTHVCKAQERMTQKWTVDTNHLISLVTRKPFLLKPVKL